MMLKDRLLAASSFIRHARPSSFSQTDVHTRSACPASTRIENLLLDFGASQDSLDLAQVRLSPSRPDYHQPQAIRGLPDRGAGSQTKLEFS